ncbi:MAG TPA: phage tail tape measure protein [Tissierellaceae bacterium]|nr:phage tail tape measure protein [Tissierellaceae bacterium]
MADGKVLIDSKLDNSGLDKGLSEMQGKLKSVGGKMKDIGKNMTKNLTLPIVAAGTGAVLMAAKFDDSMRKVKATMGENLGSSTKEADANFKALREEALKLGATTAHSASDASAAMKELAQMGYDTNKIMASTGTVLDVASAAGLELDFVAATLAGSMNQFGVEVDNNGVNIKRFGDVMVRAGQMSGTSMEEIALALEYVGSTASNAGMDIEQTSAYIGVLGDNSISGSKAGTSLNAMFRDMKTKVKDGNLEFGEFNVAMYDSQGNMRDMTDIMSDLEKGLEGKSDAERNAAIQAVFGSQAQQAVNAIMSSGTDTLKEYEKELKNANDAAKIAAGEMEGGIGGAFRALASATEGLAIAFGDILAPAIQKIAQFVAKLFLKFVELSDGQKKLIVIVAAVVAAIGPLLTVVGTLAIAIPALTTALAGMAAPIAIAIGVITALVAIGVALYKNWDMVKEKAISVFSNFAPILEPFKSAFQSVKDSVEPILESLKGLWNSLLPVFGAVATIIGGVVSVAFGVLVGVLTGVASAVEPLIKAFINLVDIVSSTVSAIVALLTGDFAGAWEYLQQAGQSTIDFFVNALTGLVKFIGGFVKGVIDFFHGLYMTLVGNSIIPDMVNEIVNWFKNMFKWVIDLVKSIVDGVKRGFEAMSNAVKVVMKAIQSVMTTIWNAIKTAITTVVNTIRTVITTVWNAIRSTVTSVMNGIRSVISSVWNAIRSVTTSVVNGIKSTITSVFNAIRSTISSVMNAIRSVVSSVWNAIRSVISSVVSAIQSVISSGFNAARNVVSSVSNAIRSTISNIFNSLKGIVASAMTGVSTAVKTGINNALSAVTNIASKFFNAGRNIATSIADGIRNGIGKVKEAAGNLVSAARRFLPFSPAKEGPLKDLDKLNFSGPISDSIKKAIPNVQAEMSHLLKMPNMDYNGNKTPSVRADNNNANEGVVSNYGKLYATLEVDGRQFATATAPYVSNEMELIKKRRG